MQIEKCPCCGWKICNITKHDKNDCYQCGATKKQRDEELAGKAERG